MDLKSSRTRKNIIYFLILLSVLPFLIFFIVDNEIPDFWLKFANISGFIGGVFLIWQFLLGIRGVIKRITPDYDWSIKIHTFLGINGALFVLSHPILETIVYNKDIRFIFQLNFTNNLESFISLGRIAFILFLFVWASSSLFRKTLSYRYWLYLHYISYPMLFFMLIHPFQIGTILNSNKYILYYWYFLVLISVTAVLIKLADVFNFSFQKLKVLEIKMLPGDIYTITYKLKGNFPIIFPGQYFYIKNSFFSEAHPFSILDFDKERKTLTFGIKTFGKYTENLRNTKIDDEHYLDGPFGEFTYEGHNDEPKVILAGGIGITPFYRLVKDFGNEDTYLFYANPKVDYALLRNEFKEMLKNNYFDFISNEKIAGKNIFCETITSSKIKEIIKDLEVNSIKFFICGSPGFTNAMIACLKELGVTKNKIFIEEFEY